MMSSPQTASLVEEIKKRHDEHTDGESPCGCVEKLASTITRLEQERGEVCWCVTKPHFHAQTPNPQTGEVK